MTQRRKLVELQNPEHEAWGPFRDSVNALRAGHLYSKLGKQTATATAATAAATATTTTTTAAVATAAPAAVVPAAATEAATAATTTTTAAVATAVVPAAATKKTKKPTAAAVAKAAAAAAAAAEGALVAAAVAAAEKAVAGAILGDLLAADESSHKPLLEALLVASKAGVDPVLLEKAAKELGSIDAQDAECQFETFMRTALIFAEKHFLRWLIELVDCSLADVPEISGPMMRALLAIYDEEEPPTIDPEETVTIEGETLNLAQLIEEMTQFVSSEELQKQSVLFMDEATVGVIRTLVHDPEDAGARARLDYELKLRVLPCPTNTHVVERGVQTGGQFVKRYAPHWAEHLRSAMHCARSNATVPEWTAAFDAFQNSRAFEKAAHLRQTTSRRWRSAGDPVKRAAAGNMNKFIIAHSVRAVEIRSAAITPEMVKASRDRKARLVENGLSREDMVTQRMAMKRDRQEEAHAQVMNGPTRVNISKMMMTGSSKRVRFDEQSREQLAAFSRPQVPQTASAMLNLDGTGKNFGAPRNKETVAQELEARGFTVKRAKKNPCAPNESMGDMIEKLKHCEGKTVIKRLVEDYDALTETRRLWQSKSPA